MSTMSISTLLALPEHEAIEKINKMDMEECLEKLTSSKKFRLFAIKHRENLKDFKIETMGFEKSPAEKVKLSGLNEFVINPTTRKNLRMSSLPKNFKGQLEYYGSFRIQQLEMKFEVTPHMATLIKKMLVFEEVSFDLAPETLILLKVMRPKNCGVYFGAIDTKKNQALFAKFFKAMPRLPTSELHLKFLGVVLPDGRSKEGLLTLADRCKIGRVTVFALEYGAFCGWGDLRDSVQELTERMINKDTLATKMVFKIGYRDGSVSYSLVKPEGLFTVSVFDGEKWHYLALREGKGTILLFKSEFEHHEFQGHAARSMFHSRQRRKTTSFSMTLLKSVEEFEEETKEVKELVEDSSERKKKYAKLSAKVRKFFK